MKNVLWIFILLSLQSMGQREVVSLNGKWDIEYVVKAIAHPENYEPSTTTSTRKLMMLPNHY